MYRPILLSGLAGLLLAACGAPAAGPAPTVAPAVSEADAQRLPTAAATSVVPQAPTSATPTASAPPPVAAPALLPEEPPPDGVGQLRTDFSRHTVPYDQILSGGPPKDGIPAIDAPQFVSVAEADEWLEPQEPVVLVAVGNDARAYPIQVLMWHEIANDTVGGVPVAVTFCRSATPRSSSTGGRASAPSTSAPPGGCVSAT